jgi:uncharacterized protein (DUF2235 family)
MRNGGAATEFWVRHRLKIRRGPMAIIDEQVSADQADDRPVDANTNGAPRPPRKFVLFADGTGNSFTTQESNVWRLYEALDRTNPDQVAYYIKGVGTSGWRPFAALDGATGIGVPSNVRKLYRFLCWNWQPGDEIYIFGFSRGAFTARTLVGLIASQGLVPPAIDGIPVSHGEMERNVMSAWREYRRDTVPLKKSLPTIWIARLIRDVALALYHTVMRHRSYNNVRAAMDKDERENRGQGGKDVAIQFLGLFDTVEAFGVPVEELRTAIDWAIWPISFRNRKLSPKVVRARHALALDDERTTFHPIRIDHPEDKANKKDARVKEVWFAGVHSDVGGGYPDATLSYVPLAWMAEQVEDELRFQPGRIDGFRAYQSPIGPIHDSRSGAAVMYRYGPRPIGEDEKTDGGPPIVHFGVVERMLHGCDNYAPIMLPASAEVRLPDGAVLPLTKDETRRAMKSAYQQKTDGAQRNAAADAFERMSKPDSAMAELALDTVWWRRFAYFSLLAMIGVLVAWPWIAMPAVDLLKGPTNTVSLGDGVSALDIIRWLDYATGAVLGPIADLLMSFLPSYAGPWLKIAVFYPFATTLVLLVLLFTWRMNAYLRNRIQERARLAWNRPKRVAPDNLAASALLPVGRWMRKNAGPLRMLFTHILLPGAFLIFIFSAALLATSRSYYNWRGGTGEFCSQTKAPTPVDDRPVTAERVFDTKNPCWASGLGVEKGRKYRIWIDATDNAWFDRTIMSGVNGFQLHDIKHLAALPFRRWFKADWFQPVLRIGAKGDAELPLEETNVMPGDSLPRPLKPTDPEDEHKRPIHIEDTAEFADTNGEVRRNWRDFGTFEPIPEAAMPAATAVWRKQGLADLMVADFVAGASGEIYLYVNDAAQILPFFGPLGSFYKNNSGTAKITLQRMPLPQLPVNQ